MKYPLLIALLCCGVMTLYAQDQQAVLNARYEAAQEDYYSNSENKQLLLTGKNYFKYYPFTAGHQYFESKNYQRTVIHYDGILYEDVSLNYDIFNKEIIISTNLDNTIRYLILDERRVLFFMMGENKFVFADEEGIEAGLYELAYEETSRLLIKYEKERLGLDRTSGAKARYKFRERKDYYYINETGSHLIESKKDLINASSEPEKAAEYLKSNKLKVNKKSPLFQMELIQVLSYLDSI